MTVPRPSPQELKATADDLGLSLTEEDSMFFAAVLGHGLAAYDLLDGLPDHLPAPPRSRADFHRPNASEDPHNAWAVRVEIKGAQTGRLSGRTIALKDNICLAGVPMTNGSETLRDFIPDIDATVVTRILEAGGTIIGKTNCEHFCLSSGSHLNPNGPVHNPYRRGHTTGGSSSGSAAAVAAGEVDMALGGDQGGSIRVPAAFCGVYGLKPTHGLVPYTGIMSVEGTLDHTGPMTRSVLDNALLLSVIAGRDDLDPRQQAAAVPTDYVACIDQGVEGLRIGVVAEGFDRPGSDAGVLRKVRAAAERFEALGAVVVDISVPSHGYAPAIWTAIAAEGLTQSMMTGNAHGTGWKGLYVPSLQKAHAGWREQTDRLSDPLKIMMLLGQHMATVHGGKFYAKAQNLGRALKSAYDEALRTYDLLLLPTAPSLAQAIPAAEASRLEKLVASDARALVNTCAFNVSGHPALSMPCGMFEGLPVGLMLVSRTFDEGTLYRAAGAFEQSANWSGM